MELTKEEKDFISELLDNKIAMRPLEVALLRSLMEFEDLNSKGWMDAGSILKRGYFTSQATNFNNYINPLIKKGLVEQKRISYKDDRKRPHKKKLFRLKLTLHVYGMIKQMFKIGGDEEEIKKTSYFKLLGQELGVEFKTQQQLENNVNLSLLEQQRGIMLNQFSRLESNIHKLKQKIKNGGK